MTAYTGTSNKSALAITALMVCGLVGLVPVSRAAEPSTSSPTVQEESTTPADSSEVQERAVIRGQRTPPETFTPSQMAPATKAQPTPNNMILVPPSSAPAPGTGVLPIVGGVSVPDYQFPWVVRMNGCAGVLIDPQWVLTAAHCVTLNIGFGKITYTRTDPYTGTVSTETRGPMFEERPNPGVYIHKDYAPDKNFANDIALIKLEKPFQVNFALQTVGLPRDFRHAGMVGTLASIDHLRPLPPGQAAIFRAPIPQDTYLPKFNITASVAMASLCPGDSGSGFVTVENGRATVRGIASQGTISDCMTPQGEATFTDVFNFRGWILQTMGKNDATLSGNTRVRWSGFVARGKMVMGCSNPNTPYWGPLNVVGVEEGAMCDGGQAQGIICQLDPNQASTKFGPPQIVGFTMRTTMADGSSQVVPLPYVSNLAQFAGPLPAGASREFTCQIGTSLTAATGAVTGANTTILSRGVEGEQPMEPIVEQPSPFDQPVGTTP